MKLKSILSIVFTLLGCLFAHSDNDRVVALGAEQMSSIYGSGCIDCRERSGSQEVCYSDDNMLCCTTAGGWGAPCDWSACTPECPHQYVPYIVSGVLSVDTFNSDCPTGTAGGTCFLITTGPDHCVCGSTGPIDCGRFPDNEYHYGYCP